MLLYTSYQTQSTIQMYMKIAVGIIPFFFFFLLYNSDNQTDNQTPCFYYNGSVTSMTA